METTGNFAFDKNGESFVQPEMFKIAVGHQISSPAVGDLVSDQINKRTIASLTQENDNATN